MNFENYLKEKGFTQSTIASHNYNIGQFKAWLIAQNIEETKVTYGDITTFISQLKNNKSRTINHKLNSLRKYFDYLKIIPNPANNIHIKGNVKTIPQGLLNERELNSIYNDYKTTSKVNKTILGLIIYQAINTGEISKSTINVENQTIQIQGGKRSNPRVLVLHQNQLKEAHKDLSQLTNQSINNRLQKILKRIKKTHPKVKNTRQLRASRIILWLKDYNLRQVQYMAGHRYISSTEKYQTTDLQSLARSIEKYHPT